MAFIRPSTPASTHPSTFVALLDPLVVPLRIPRHFLRLPQQIAQDSESEIHQHQANV